MLGCKLLNSDMTLQPSCRRLPHLLDQILILLKLHNFFPRLKPVRDYYMVDYLHNDTRKVEQVMGACLMTRKEIIDNIGGLDENYGSIFEEVDFCKRVLDNGWKIYFTPEARIVHHKGQSFRQRKIITNQKNFNRALLRYFRKYESFWQYLIILLLWPVSMFLAVVDQMMNLAGIRGFKAKFKNKNY
ncbi:MAG: glycosyltransferase family 2 protein [bacterium]